MQHVVAEFTMACLDSERGPALLVSRNGEAVRSGGCDPHPTAPVNVVGISVAASGTDFTVPEADFAALIQAVGFRLVHSMDDEHWNYRLEKAICAKASCCRGFLLRGLRPPEILVRPGAKTLHLFRLAGCFLPRFPGRASGFYPRRALPQRGLCLSSSVRANMR
jgi:hypothetical protein